jgi:hypothetical protein
MYTLTVSLSTLRAARTHSADKDIRSYLCGVYLDTAHGFVVATDGHRMMTAVEPGVRKPFAMPVIIPNDMLDAALKQFAGEHARGKPLGAVDVSITVDGAALAIMTPIGQVHGRALDGVFPEWRRVVPKADSLKPITPTVCNWQYIADACDAFAIARNVPKNKAGQHSVAVHYQGDSPAIVTDGSGDMLVIVMPMRHSIPAEAAAAACGRAHVDTTPAPTAAEPAADAA